MGFQLELVVMTAVHAAVESSSCDTVSVVPLMLVLFRSARNAFCTLRSVAEAPVARSRSRTASATAF